MRKKLWTGVIMIVSAATLVLAAVSQPAVAGAKTGRAPKPEVVSRAARAQTFGAINYINNKVWKGEFLFGTQNDWEPDVAADPFAPYVYVITTRYGKRNAACASDCPVPALVYKVSADNGVTWGPDQFLCACHGSGWQADPQLEVADDGTVYALILEGSGGGHWREDFLKSTDHGATWSAPIDVAASMEGGADHGFLTVSPDGTDVYVAMGVPVGNGSSYVAASHDGGATFAAPVRTNPPGSSDEHWYYDYKGDATNTGTVNIAVATVGRHPYAEGNVQYFNAHSTDGGATWTQYKLDTFKEQPACSKGRCRQDHLGGLSGVAGDGAGHLVHVYAGTRRASRGQQIWISTSADGGATWTPSMPVSPKKIKGRRVISAFPTVISGGVGNFRVWWMDDRNNEDSLNVWYTESNDNGLTWTPQVRISDATSGTGYKHKRGFLADYGDYGGIAVMSSGKTVATWGEAFSYWGPGGTWINIQP